MIEYQTILDEIHNSFILKKNKGTVATYIPELSNVDVKHPNPEETNNFVQLTFLIGKFTPELSLLLIILSFITSSFAEINSFNSDSSKLLPTICLSRLLNSLLLGLDKF